LILDSALVSTMGPSQFPALTKMSLGFRYVQL
jgi:hypothetical protein